MEKFRNFFDLIIGMLDTILLFLIAGLFTMLRKFTSEHNLKFKIMISNMFINMISGITLYSIAIYIHESIDEYPIKIGAIVITTMVGDRILTGLGDTLVKMMSTENLKELLKKIFNL